MAGDSEIIIRVVRNEAQARDCELVLLSQGLSPHTHPTPDGIAVTVPGREVERALAGLAAYEKESVSNARETQGSPQFDLPAGVVTALLLLGFFALSVWRNEVPWFEGGSANAARILDGEFWRTVTALTLHADVAHALSNAFAMAVFFAAVAGQLGAGIAAAFVLAAGAIGNLANAYVHGSPHNAVGASTAVFGAVGMLGSLAMVRRSRAMENRRRAWMAIAASLALLGMLGSSGARVDVLAHFLGFLAGGVLGSAVGLCLRTAHVPTAQWFCGAAAAAIVIGCWMLALN